MSDKISAAKETFRSGLNCAQSVLAPYIEELGYDRKTAISLACGFGGGMGRLQQTCGAVTGAFMALGLYNCKKYTEIKDKKEKTAEMVRNFNEKFLKIHNTTSCRDLLGQDIRTEEGRAFVQENNLHEKICEECIKNAIIILDEIMKE